MKKKHYVGVLTDAGNSIKYVTGIDNAARMAAWEDGVAARAFTQAVARDIAEGLLLNGYPAVVLEAPECLHLTNAYPKQD